MMIATNDNFYFSREAYLKAQRNIDTANELRRLLVLAKVDDCTVKEENGAVFVVDSKGENVTNERWLSLVAKLSTAEAELIHKNHIKGKKALKELDRDYTREELLQSATPRSRERFFQHFAENKDKMVFPDFDPAKHVVPSFKPKESKFWFITSVVCFALSVFMFFGVLLGLFEK